MPDARPPMWRRLPARRWQRIVLVVVVLTIAVRLALPAIVRRVVVAQADAALVGRIELDDVDLALFRGGFTLHGVRVFATEAKTNDADARPGARASGSVAGAATSTPASAADAEAAAPSPIATPSSAASTSPQESVEHGVARATSRPSPVPSAAGIGAPGEAPVFSADRIAVRVGFLPFFHHTVEIQRLELAGVAVSLDRDKDGTLVLPAAVPSTTPPPPPTNAGPGWGVLIRSVALRDGRIGFRDFAVGDPPQHVEVTLPTLDAGDLALLITQRGLGPGKVTLDAGIQDGTLHLDATLETLAAGPAYESHAVLTNIPIGGGRLYIPHVGWSDLSGRLDADVVHRFESQGAHTLRGKAALRDLAVRVAGLDEPALAWKALDVDVAGIDFVAQHADVARVTLAGARVLTRPGGPEPMPVLRGLVAAAAGKTAPPPADRAAGGKATPSPDAATAAGATPADTTDTRTRSAASPAPSLIPSAAAAVTTAASPAPSAPPSPASDAAPAASPAPAADAAAASSPSPPAGVSATVQATTAKPWTWAIGTVRVEDGRVRALGGDAPLDVGVDADLAKLASAAGTHTELRIGLAPATGGHVDLTGDLTVDPLGFAGKLGVKDLTLAPLTRPIANATTRLVHNAVANLDLDVAVGATPQAPPDGVRLAGTLGLTDLDVAGDDPKAFAVRWKGLALVARSVTAPGILKRGATPGPIDVALTSFTLTRPELVLTRNADGIVLPAPFGPGAAPVPSPEASPGVSASPRRSSTPVRAPASQPTPATTPIQSNVPAPIQARIDRVAIQHLRIDANDTAVQPFYRSTLDPVDLDAADVHWPDTAASNLKLVANGLDGATFTLTGNVAPAGSRLVAKLSGLPLAPFNPYAASTGYGIGGGTAQIESTIKLAPGRYDTTNRLVLHQLDVRSGEGDTLFTSRFGMPLSLALSLMTDLHGDIVLDLPVTADAKGTRTDLGTVVGNALARAILNAVTSPLKLIGAVANIGEKPASLAPPPLAFLLGRPTLAEGEVTKLGQLAHLLAAAPGVKLHLRGEAGADDRRWLQEQALRATLEKESGVVGQLRHIGERGARGAVLAALTARAEGRDATVPPEHQAWFESQVAAQSVPDAALHDLAAARATAIAEELGHEQGVARARIVLDDPLASGVDARAVVTVGLGSVAPSAAPKR